jgi:WD40 repeat protein
VKAWDLTRAGDLRKSGDQARRARHAGPVTAVALSGDGKTAISAANGDAVKVWAVGSGTLLRELDWQLNPVQALALDDDGRIAIVGEQAALRVCDTRTGRLLRTHHGSGDGVLVAALSSNGRFALCRTQDDDALKIWDVATGQVLATLLRGDHDVRNAALSASGAVVYRNAAGNAFEARGARSITPLLTLGEESTGDHVFALSADETMLALTSNDFALRVWDTASPSRLASFVGDALFTSVAFDRHGHILAGDDVGCLHLLELRRSA